ncbi:hypothetical protein [Draconibacterium orientale]|uniref:hypothetical protein n=1 Tax=Draconibacterium orientale TaxID=1168034 RepID=UPI002A0A91E9|nr:hypothetical protein [Draconibacterium orientale]
MKKKSAYIITKPLQYINATNIPDKFFKDCFLVDSFSNSASLFKKIQKYSNHWDNIYIRKNRYLAITSILINKRKYKNLYTDTDFGIFNRLLLLSLYPINIFVYEEGIGSYKKEIREKNSIFQKALISLDSLLGKNYFAGFKRSKGIYLYQPYVYKEIVCPNTDKQVLKFDKDFFKHISNFREIPKIFPFPENLSQIIVGKKVIVYLTSWEIDYKFLEIFSNYPDFIKILKPHPHLKKPTGIEKHFDFLVKNSIPAEIFLTRIVKLSCSTILIHQGSSFVIYLDGIEKLRVYNLADEKFENIFDSYFEVFNNSLNK